MAKPITPQEREAILADIQAGTLSRNAIARKHGRSAGTITNIAKAEGIADVAFNRSVTVNASRARSIDLADARLRLQQRWVAKANEALDRSEGQCEVYAFGGAENRFNSEVMALPPAAEYRSFVTAAAVATDKLVALAKYDSADNGVEQAVSTIETIMGALRGSVASVDEDH